jgi:cell division septal protein FtsQ
MRMRQTITDFESAFVEEMAEDRQRREELARQAQRRTQRRRVEKQHKHGTLRFAAIVLTLIATAVLVTVAMFETLYRVMG